MDYISTAQMKENVCIVVNLLMVMDAFRHRHVNIFMGAATENVFIAE